MMIASSSARNGDYITTDAIDVEQGTATDASYQQEGEGRVDVEVDREGREAQHDGVDQSSADSDIDSDDSNLDGDRIGGGGTNTTNRRSRSSGTLWCKRWLWLSKELRTFVIIAIIAYTLFIQITAGRSNNWETSRLVGFVQPGVCVDAANRYGIRDYDIVFTPPGQDPEIYKPLGYKDGSPDTLCFDANTLAKCSPILQTIDTGESIYEFKSYFHRDKRNYFPYSTFIDILGFICLLLTVLYEGPDEGAYFINSGEMSTPVDRTVVKRANHVITVILIIIIFVAASKQHFFYEENCKDIYKDSSTKNEYCKYITSCGMILASSIRPEDFSIRGYKATMITLGTFLILGAVSRCVIPNNRVFFIVRQQRRPYRTTQFRRNHRIGDLTRDIANEEEWLGQQVQINVPLTSMTILSSIVFHNGHDAITRVAPLTIAHERKADWIILGNKDLLALEEECPICLQQLNSMNSQKFPVKGNHSQKDLATAGSKAELGDEETQDVVDPSLTSSEEVVRITCDHIFHTKCIENWMLDHHTCPVCRKTI